MKPVPAQRAARRRGGGKKGNRGRKVELTISASLPISLSVELSQARDERQGEEMDRY